LAGLNIVQTDIVVEVYGEESDNAEVGQSFEEVRDIDPPESPGCVKQIDKRLCDFFESGTEKGRGFGHRMKDGLMDRWIIVLVEK
jgi:hypothetical protein